MQSTVRWVEHWPCGRAWLPCLGGQAWTHNTSPPRPYHPACQVAPCSTACRQTHAPINTTLHTALYITRSVSGFLRCYSTFNQVPEKRTHQEKWSRFFQSPTSFLSTIQQCQSHKQSSKHWLQAGKITNGLHLFNWSTNSLLTEGTPHSLPQFSEANTLWSTSLCTCKRTHFRGSITNFFCIRTVLAPLPHTDSFMLIFINFY